jgi:hypothetical protein
LKPPDAAPPFDTGFLRTETAEAILRTLRLTRILGSGAAAMIAGA